MNNNITYIRLNDMIINQNKYSSEECHKASILIKFYNDPISILGDGHSPTPKEYMKIAAYNELFLNNDFVSLLNNGLEDEEFVDKLSLQLLLKIYSILKSGIICQKEYIPGILSKVKRVDGKIKALSKDGADKQTYSQALDRLNELKRHLKYSRYSEEQVRSFKGFSAGCVCNKIVTEFNYFNYATEDIAKQKEQILSKIATEHYISSHNNNNLLERDVVNFGLGRDTDLVISAVLDNRFTDIIVKFIQNNNLNDRMINNSIKLFEMGIKIKERKLCEYELYLARYFDPDFVKQFDVNKAKQAISQLESLKSKKEASKLRLTKKN